MGCCVSAQNGPSRAPKSQNQVQRVRPAIESRAPPPSAEEETVKEVLSETPTTPKVAPIPISSETQPYYSTKILKPQKPVFERVSESVLLSPKAEISELSELKSPRAEEFSEEVSEICSLSESVSGATNLTDEFAVQYHHQRTANRSPAKVQPSRNRSGSGSGDLGARRDQARRSDQSPGRRNAGSVRMVQSREPSRPQSVPRRRDPGESSARRSRSPVTRIENAGTGTGGATRQGVGRSPSARRTNPSPGRVRADQNERGRDPEGRGEEGNTNDLGKRPNGDESLENPLVSLECFIFL